MKRFLVLFICFLLLFSGCKNKSNKNLNNDIESQGKDIFSSSIDDIDNSGYIVYGRYGGEKEICSVNSTGKKHIEIYKGDYDKASGFGDKLVFYSKNQEEKGIYLLKANEKKSTLLIDSFRFTQKPCFSNDGSMIAFYAYPKYDPNDNEQYKQRLYYMNVNGNEPIRIKNVAGDIKHISFIDNESLLYAKSVQNNGGFQIYSYSIKENTETRLMKSDSNDVNPVISPDGTRIAFLSDKYRNYNLFILNLSDNTIQEIDTNDAVVGESVVWSPDGSKIAYVTLNGVAKYNVKLADLKQSTTNLIGNGYLAAFSSSGKSLVYASYEIKNENELEKKQIIYKMNIEGGKAEKVWDFPEESVFSRSINVLYWTNSLDVIN